MEIDKRIITLIEILGLTPTEFADKINVQRSGISHITSGRNKPSLDFLERTLTIFPKINSEWLILGKGKPLKSLIEEKKENPSPTIDTINIENQSPLLFPIDEPEKELADLNTTSLHTNNLTDSDTSIKKEEINKKEEKKEIKKIIILYKDNSFEIYES